jgi:hypothetical protein
MHRGSCPQPGSALSDPYVYYFIGSAGEKNALANWPATLDAIKKSEGEAIMESEIVVDDTNLDGSGYFIARVGYDSYAVNDLPTQIWSLEVRAASRDIEALNLNDSSEGKDKYMLSLESRALRGQARKLKCWRSELLADERRNPRETGDSVHCGGRTGGCVDVFSMRSEKTIARDKIRKRCLSMSRGLCVVDRQMTCSGSVTEITG